jgi:hypothetical protein
MRVKRDYRQADGSNFMASFRLVPRQSQYLKNGRRCPSFMRRNETPDYLSPAQVTAIDGMLAGKDDLKERAMTAE